MQLPPSCARMTRLASVRLRVVLKGEEKDIKFYPLMNIITDVEEKFKDDMVSGTVVVQSVIEISKQDYDAYNVRIAKMNK